MICFVLRREEARVHVPTLCCTCRDELLTNCKEATAISAVPWCFTEYNNKRRACTEETGAVRPLTWYLKDNQVRLHSHCRLLFLRANFHRTRYTAVS